MVMLGRNLCHNLTLEGCRRVGEMMDGGTSVLEQSVGHRERVRLGHCHLSPAITVQVGQEISTILTEVPRWRTVEGVPRPEAPGLRRMTPQVPICLWSLVLSDDGGEGAGVCFRPWCPGRAPSPLPAPLGPAQPALLLQERHADTAGEEGPPDGKLKSCVLHPLKFVLRVLCI
jgi:hypothetical protein